MVRIMHCTRVLAFGLRSVRVVKRLGVGGDGLVGSVRCVTSSNSYCIWNLICVHIDPSFTVPRHIYWQVILTQPNHQITQQSSE